jgi:ribosomal protein S18 acetylase RimI-like enzyme
MPRTRLATPADQARLLPLVRELWRHERLGWDDARTPAALARLLEDESLGRVWIAEDDDGPAIGYLALCFGYSLEFLGRDAFIDELYVDDAFRGRGLGRHLIAVAEAAAAELDVVALHLEVDDENPRAHSLYAELGFETHARALMTKRPSARGR